MARIVTFVLLGISGCAPMGPGSAVPPTQLDGAAANATITESDLLRHTRILASDAYEGRAPGTAGGELTVTYLEDAFRGMGLEPGAPDGSYRQAVPLVRLGRPVAALEVRAGGRTFAFHSPDSVVTYVFEPLPPRRVDDAELVFVGYGIVASEYDWDDYKEADVRGEIVVALDGDPPVRDPTDSTKLDERVFDGEGRSSFGGPGAKARVAAERGAAGMLIVYDPNFFDVPFSAAATEAARERLILHTSGEEVAPPTPPMAPLMWLAPETANQLFAAAEADLSTFRQAAVDRGFEPRTLVARASMRVAMETEARDIMSWNVIARLDGADPEKRDDYVLYVAHWDHLGRDVTRTGDQIFNGAVDNAAGTAQLIEIAEAFAGMEPRLPRTLLFLATTAEENGLLGARHYVAHPPYPLEHTLAAINLDWAQPFGRTLDVVNITDGHTTLDEVLAEAARAQGRVVAPDPEPELGYIMRSDHAPFMRVGVPALFAGSGVDYVDNPDGKERMDEYDTVHIHQPSDSLGTDWDFTGIVEDARLLFDVGLRTASQDARPEWKATTTFPEFRARREMSLQNR